MRIAGEVAEELRARDQAEARVENGRRRILAVVEVVAPARKMPIEHREAEFGGVVLVGELRLGEERSAERRAIAAADQRTRAIMAQTPQAIYRN